MWRFLKKLEIELPYDPEIPLLGIDRWPVAAKDGAALYTQLKQDWELTMTQIMNSLLPNPDLN